MVVFPLQRARGQLGRRLKDFPAGAPTCARGEEDVLGHISSDVGYIEYPRDKWGQSPRNESSVALGSIVVIAMYSVYVLKIDPPTTFKIFPKIDSLMSCSLCPQSLGHENISF